MAETAYLGRRHRKRDRPTKLFGATVDAEIVREVDLLVVDGAFMSRSDAVERALREMLDRRADVADEAVAA